MRTAILAALVLVLAGSPALAGDGRDTGSDGNETPERWLEWTTEFAEELRASGRVMDSIEETVNVSTLDPTETERLIDATLLVLTHAARGQPGLRPRTLSFQMAVDLIDLIARRGGEDDPRVYYAAGRLRFAELDFLGAHASMLKARDTDFEPELVEQWFFRCTVNIAPDLASRGMYDEAIEALLDVMERSPDHPDMAGAKINLAAAHRGRNEFLEAERLLREVIESRPGSARPWNTLGQVLHEQNRLDEALDAYNRAVAISAGANQDYSEPLLLKIEVLVKLARLKEAEQAIEGFEAVFGENVKAFYLRALMAREEGRTMDAIRHLRRALQKHPEESAVLRLLSAIHYERGELEEADKITAEIERISKKYEHSLIPDDDEESGDDTADDPEVDSPSVGPDGGSSGDDLGESEGGGE